MESPKHEIIHPGVAKPEGAFSYGDEKEPETHYYDADEGGAGGYGQQGNADVVDQNDNGKAERQPSAPSAGGDRNQYQDENDVRIGNLEEQEDLCEALVAELDEQSKPKRPSGANREGLRDYVVLRSGYTACDDPEAAFDEATRLGEHTSERLSDDKSLTWPRMQPTRRQSAPRSTLVSTVHVRRSYRRAFDPSLRYVQFITKARKSTPLRSTCPQRANSQT